MVWDPEQNLCSEVHAAATIRSLADRVGPVPRGSRAIEAAMVHDVGRSRASGVVPSTQVVGSCGWESLRHAMRSWSINSEEDLSAWLGRSGFPARSCTRTHRDGRLPSGRPSDINETCFRGVDVGWAMTDDDPESRWIQTPGWPQPEIQVGEGFDRFGGFRWRRGREFANGPQTSPEGGTGSACRSPNPREGGFHRTGKETDRPNRRREAG